ncbi:uncharacterized protein LOC143465288 [Clavelina lepadiformis]|uniref:uncharacterized protein LOC143465288 n=1 Tax=Clavelina lepadiformis TaxID=159417 RepID=UPI004040F490
MKRLKQLAYKQFMRKASTNNGKLHKELRNKHDLMLKTAKKIFEFIEDCDTFDSAVETLQNLLVKKRNKIFARHLLATRKLQTSESRTQFMQTLQIPSKNCQHKYVTAEQNCKKLCRDAFINGLSSPSIRQRLLENTTLSLESAVDQAHALDIVIKNASAYSTTFSSAFTNPQSLHPRNKMEDQKKQLNKTTTYIAAYLKKKKCYFCGYDFDERNFCPARPPISRLTNAGKLDFLILETDRVYTAFEADGKLQQYKRIPYGVTNGGINFQREVDRIIDEENLNDVFAYQDNVTVCGRTQQEHDDNVQNLLTVFKRRNLTFNESKTVKSVPRINVLGYKFQHKTIKQHPDRLQPLQEYSLPQNKKALHRLLGLLSYYSKWISQFSDKVKPLKTVQSFPLSEDAEQAFQQVITELATTSLQSIEETTPFVVVSDPSDVAV